MTLRATLRCTGCGLLGHEDGAHAAFADLLQQLVRADDRAGVFGERSGSGIQHALRPLVRQKQRLDCGAELPIVAARPFEKRRALGRGGNFGRLKKDRFFRVQWC